jgi:hypothetical protein
MIINDLRRNIHHAKHRCCRQDGLITLGRHDISHRATPPQIGESPRRSDAVRMIRAALSAATSV